MKGSGIGLLVVSLMVGYLLFNYFVLRYAVIEDPQNTQDSSEPATVWYSFMVKKGGVVDLGYEKMQHSKFLKKIQKFGPYDMNWGVDPSKSEFTAFIRSRWGILPTWETKTFAVSRGR